ncbi:hypothetical protein C8F01DRAFT_1094638 [Mycena amicta]|nr:hypothetical protein C8F01DRAFT_1094638 [Mycena amicta]
MSDGSEYEAAQVLVSLRTATNVNTSTQLMPQSDPLTFLLDLSPSLTHQTVLPFNPLSLALLAYHDQETLPTPPQPARTQSTVERATPPFTIPRVPYPSPSFRPLLPRRDTPFPYFDPEQRAQTQRQQLEVLESRGKGVVAESSATLQETMPVIEEEEEANNDERRGVTQWTWTRRTIHPQHQRPRRSARRHPPTVPTLVATIANTESVNAAITELGLPVDRPPTVFQVPLFQQRTRFNTATYTILRHYLPNDPHLQAMAEKIVEFQAHAPEAERLALLRDVLAAFLKLIIRRVEDEQARAQEALGDNVVHGWTMLLEALHWSHERLADETSAALEKVLEIASEYAFLLGKVTEAIDEVHEREVAAYQNRLTTSGRVSRNESAPTLERPTATLDQALPVVTNETPGDGRSSPVGDSERMHGTSRMKVLNAGNDEANGETGWEFMPEEPDEVPLQTPEEERELANGLAGMQFGPEEISREGMMPTILAPIPIHPSSVNRLEASVNPNDMVGSSSLAPLDFPLDTIIDRSGDLWETTHEGMTHNVVRVGLNNGLTGSPSQSILNELLDKFGQLQAAGEQEPAHRILQRAFAYVLRHPFSPDDGDPDIFRDDTRVLARTSSDDTEQGSVTGEFSPDAVETLTAVQQAEDEYRRAADEFLVPPSEQPVADNALGLILEEETPVSAATVESPMSAVVYAAWPQGSIVSASDTAHVSNTIKFGFGTATLARLDVHEACPPTPVVHRQPAAAFPAVTRGGPGQWEQPPVAFADNNPCYPLFRPRPNQPYDPLLPLEVYAKKGAFLRAPMDRGISNASSTSITSGRPSFLLYLSDLRLNHHPYALPDALGPRMEQELAMARPHNPYALGQLLDHDSIEAPNGYRLAYLFDYHERPIYVDPMKEDAELKQVMFRKPFQFFQATQLQRSPAGPHFDLALHARALRTHALAFIQRALPFLVSLGADLDHAAYQWYHDHNWATRRQFFGTHSVLRPFERALGEIIWSQLSEHGYHSQASDWACFLNVRYVCDDVLEDLLEIGWLDLDAEVGEEGLWTQQLPNLVYDDHSSFTAANTSLDEERKRLFRDDQNPPNDLETESSSDELSYFSQDDDDDDDSIICETTFAEELPNPQTWTTFRTPLSENFNLTHPNELPPGTTFIIDSGAPVTVSTLPGTIAAISEPLHIYVANPTGSVHPPPTTHEQQVPLNTSTGDTERIHIAEPSSEYEDVSDGESLIEMDVREEDDGWYDYASDGGSWA